MKGLHLLERDGGWSLRRGSFAAGRSPDRRLLAEARADGVHVTEGWDGPRVARWKGEARPLAW